mmetsp:Transcript_1736/g.2081  ORF Transcript_1736/g.2081 Transcript_1736/m.2081 type:complete len:561 (-) Transcript_1736:240-1922(-)
MKTSKTFVALLCVLCTLDHRAKADLAIISKLGTSLTTSNKIANIPEQDRTVLTCEDTTERFEVIEPNGKKKMKTCDWVAEEKTNWRCGRPGVSLQCPLTCDACCEDSEEKYRVTIGTFAGKKKTCTWAGEKVRPRCNDPAAQEACPASCGLCPSPGTPAPTVATKAPTGSTPAPSTMGPTASPTSAAPTQYYDWCVDSEERFPIDSAWWINKPKSCAWARKSNPYSTCSINEVQQNCPYTCKVCQCFNNQERFETKSGLKSCAWAAREDTWWRCNNLEAVRRNCPLLCGECEVEFPSVAPSAAPSIQKFPTVVVESKAELGLDGLDIPEDPDELAIMKEALVKSVSAFIPEGSEVTNAEIVYTQARQAGIVGKLILTIVKKIALTATATPEAAAEAAAAFVNTLQSDLAESIEGGEESPLNTAIQGAFEEIGKEFVAFLGDAAAAAGIEANVTETVVLDPTQFPSASPTEAPTPAPSITTSALPSDKPSSAPTITPSATPTNFPSPSPSSQPTASPSKKPTIQPSPKPSVASVSSAEPSSEPSSEPSDEPSSEPSSEPSM